MTSKRYPPTIHDETHNQSYEKHFSTHEKTVSKYLLMLILWMCPEQVNAKFTFIMNSTFQ